MTIQRENEDQRKKLWCDVFVAVANSDNSVRETTCKKYADYALKEFDKTFCEEREANNGTS